MKKPRSFRRYAAAIGITMMATLAVIVIIDRTSSSADAQPAPSPAAGSASTSGSASASSPTVTPVAPEISGPRVQPPSTGPATPAADPASKQPGPAGQPAPVPAAQTQRAWYEELAYRPIDEDGTFWMPKSVNLVADDSDMMFYATLALSAFFFFAITIVVVYFVIKYRHRPGHKPEPSPAHHDALEITWTVIPTIIVVFLFYYGWRTYIHVVTPPNKAVEINLLAWRWNWQFTHANGVEDSDLHIPVDTPVRVVMTSKDVLHAFYAPAMRVKQDIIPRRYTHVWFHATKPGTYRLTCAEYCGTDHSQMGKTADGRRAVVVVHKTGDYERYLADKQALEGSGDPLEHGRRLYEKKGCVTCHSTDGSARVGPTFKGLFGSTWQEPDGTNVLVDENHIRESLMSPNAKSRAGFPAGTMPSFEGQLKERDIEGLITYIKSLQ